MASKNNIRGWLTDINNVGTLAQSGRPHDLFAFKINYNQVEDNTTNGVVPLYNGNISETYWRSYNDNVLRNYGYTYDALNRLEEAFYQKPGYTQPNVNNYREKLAYDPNGNITHLWRNGDMDATNFALEIDDLTYTYAPESNLLLKVTDATAHAGGFHDDSPDGTLASDPSDDYAYDALGNMVKDENKTIRSIKYNHLNLPTFIDFGARGTISYFYDATGRKVRKVVRDNVLSNNKVTDYANGFQYLDNVIQHFPTAEGYASRLNLRQENGVVALLPSTELPVDFFTYVYNYTDHLGNIRLSYAQDPDTQQLKIVEQNHYYPFGLRHTNYSGGKMQVVKEQELKRMAPTPEELLSYKYKYNGKEWQDELGLNVTAMDFRQYDNAIGRFNSIDLLSEMNFSASPFIFSNANPIFWSDPSGLLSQEFIDSIWKNSTNSSGKTVWVNSGDNFFSEDVGNGKSGFIDGVSGEFSLYDNLPPVEIIRNKRGDASYIGQLQSHVYHKGKFYESWRDKQNQEKWNDFAEGLQDTGDIISGVGYILTPTGVGAIIGVPLAALGNTISTTGAIIHVGNSFYHQGLSSGNAWKTVGFQVAGKVAEHYINKVPGLEPTIKSIDNDEVTNLSNKIIQQNINLKIIGIERYYDYKTKKD